MMMALIGIKIKKGNHSDRNNMYYITHLFGIRYDIQPITCWPLSVWLCRFIWIQDNCGRIFIQDCDAGCLHDPFKEEMNEPVNHPSQWEEQGEDTHVMLTVSLRHCNILAITFWKLSIEIMFHSSYRWMMAILTLTLHSCSSFSL